MPESPTPLETQSKPKASVYDKAFEATDSLVKGGLHPRQALTMTAQVWKQARLADAKVPSKYIPIYIALGSYIPIPKNVGSLEDIWPVADCGCG